MRKKNILNVLMFLIILSVGIFIGTKLPKNTLTQGEAEEDSYQAGWDAAKERLKLSPLGMATSAEVDIRNISGVIQKIEGDKLTVKVSQLDPLSDPDLDVRIITMDANTKVYSNVQKKSAQLQAEMQEFQDAIVRQSAPGESAPTLDPALPPMPFEKRDATSADLKENQQISITASENIKDKKEFSAIVIDVREFISAASVEEQVLPGMLDVSVISAANSAAVNAAPAADPALAVTPEEASASNSNAAAKSALSDPAHTLPVAR